MRLDWYVQLGVHVAEKLSEWETPVSGEAPTESGLPGVRGDQATDAGGYDQALEDNGAAPVHQGLVVELEDGDEGGGVEEAV